MGYGTVLASFNVEEFGTERVARLTREEIDERFELLREMTNFDALPASAEVAPPARHQRATARKPQTAILATPQHPVLGGVMATDQQSSTATADGGVATGSETLTVTDNRTGKTYELPIADNTIRGLDLRQIKVDEDEFGMLSYDPAFTNTASCRSSITFIDGDAGILEHRGYSIEQLCERSTFLEVAYLLIFGELPTAAQLERWVFDITHHTYVHEDLKHLFQGFRYDAHPMGMLLAGVGALSTFYPDAKQTEDPEERYMAAVRLIAKIPTLAAFSYRHNMGFPYAYPDNDLNYSENFLSMMFKKTEAKHVPKEALSKALDVLFILHADHEQNCSTNAVRGVGSSDVDPYSAVAAGVAALYGPLHGGANEAVLRMLRRIESPDNIPDFLERVKDREEKLMGFGHRVYKNYDPRARIIQQHMDEVFEATEYNPLVEIARELEKRALDDDYFTSRKLYPNVDFYSGIIYEALEIPTNMFTVIFAIPRTAGWVAQWMEMKDDPEQKIARPRQIYTGEREREYVADRRSGGARENRRAAGAQAQTAPARRLNRSRRKRDRHPSSLNFFVKRPVADAMAADWRKSTSRSEGCQSLFPGRLAQAAETRCVAWRRGRLEADRPARVRRRACELRGPGRGGCGDAGAGSGDPLGGAGGACCRVQGLRAAGPGACAAAALDRGPAAQAGRRGRRARQRRVRPLPRRRQARGARPERPRDAVRRGPRDSGDR